VKVLDGWRSRLEAGFLQDGEQCGWREGAVSLNTTSFITMHEVDAGRDRGGGGGLGRGGEERGGGEGGHQRFWRGEQRPGLHGV
jgi:hypothetical protein